MNLCDIGLVWANRLNQKIKTNKKASSNEFRSHDLWVANWNVYSGMGAIRKKLPPGDHTISIMKDGFYTFTKEVLIVSKTTNQQEIILEEKIGSVKIK